MFNHGICSETVSLVLRQTHLDLKHFQLCPLNIGFATLVASPENCPIDVYTNCICFNGIYKLVLHGKLHIPCIPPWSIFLAQTWCYVAHRRIVAPSCYVLDIWRCAELMHSQTPWWRLLSQSPGTQDLPIAFNTMLSRQMTWRMIFAGASQGRNPQKDGVGNLKNHGQRIIYKQEGLAFSLWGVPRVHHYPIFRVELLLYWRV